ncbi:hypothetical protein SAMN04487765_3344 [Tenacibaculum sp. MAR_2010_89]|uniref:hypothetical protein n=1 Tax=Tenacibaculum sp. MAR_2010_89 TaxID=1250198 RepID=UPI00089AA04C|nr:hypothetical protein [Tenacibaculum sp. MAR_2010_89]SEE60339.1 hypothetical protein SAMN04487765_3344 [Tenacibaculum sp. MAR_2010_89]
MDIPEKLGKESKFHESYLSFLRKGTKEELKILLNTAIINENYELARKLKNIIDNIF